MRFAAITRTLKTQPPLRTTASEAVLRPAPGEPRVKVQPAPAKPQDVPPDLDQRVRLAGEW